MRSPVLILLLGAAAFAQRAAEVRGSVVDAQTGEPLARVRVQLLASTYQALTDDKGRFDLGMISPGGYTLQVATVGYRVARQEFRAAAGEIKEFEVILSADTFRQTDSVEVRGDPFEPLRQDIATELTLTGNEVKNLASVLADDPLRAVQALPGVTSDDDFNARFSLRGASFERIGLYLDDVLLHTPFHTVQDRSASGTLTIFNGDMVEDMALYSGVFPARYGDRTAGALDVRIREGSRKAPSVRGTASASNAGLMSEGPLGRAGRGSWMASVRKSYLEYIVNRTSDDDTLAGGFWDAQGRLSYDLFPKHNLSLSVFDGTSGFDRERAYARLGINSIMVSSYHFTLASLAWRYVPGGRFLLTTRGAFSREKYRNDNKDRLSLTGGQYGEWVWNAAATWIWTGRNALDLGWSLRRIKDAGFTNLYQFNPYAVRQRDGYGGNGRIAGGYAQQTWNAGRLRFSAGGRWDHFTATGAAVVSPRVSLAMQLHPATQLQLAWGQYAQFPPLQSLLARYGDRGLAPERSINFQAAIEHRIGERSRVRLEAYQRLDRDLLFRPFYEPRLINGVVFNPPIDAPVRNSTRGYARGLEMFFQRRTANRFTGWISYALSYSRLRDGLARVGFPADEDQRHTVNIYAGYRIRPSVNLSLKWLSGSGFPIPGFFERAGQDYYLAGQRNALRLDSYHRADVRINKAWIFDRWKITLYGEVVNLFNHANRRYDAFNGYNARTGQAWPGFTKLFPILPSAGIVMEF